MERLLRDLRYGGRRLVRDPGFTLAAVTCIALGIGANAATYSFARALLVHVPAVREPERLVRLFTRFDSGLRFGAFSYPDYQDLRDHSEALLDLVVETPTPYHLSRDGRNERIWGSIVSGNYFSALGVDMALGRGFLTEEDQDPLTHPVVVIGHGLWRSRFAADPAVLDQTVSLNGRPFTIVGVAPAGFRGTNVGVGPELWVPMMMLEWVKPGTRALDSRAAHWIPFTIGRLAPGITLQRAVESTDAFMARLAERYPDSNGGVRVEIFAESEAGLHPFVRPGFALFIRSMQLVVGLVLLLACANVAGLLLARSSQRRREIGIRLSLGASRQQLIVQLLAESSILATLAGGVGLLLGFVLIRLVAALEPPTDLPIRLDVGLDIPVVAFVLFVSLLTGLIFGLIPALHNTRKDLATALTGHPGAGSTASAARMRQGLVVGQIALSLSLLAGAGLLVSSLRSMGEIDLGFDPQHLAVASVDLTLQGYDEPRGRQLQRDLVTGLAALPDIVSVGLGELIPLNLSRTQNTVLPEGYVVPGDTVGPGVDRNIVDAGYFETMAIPILSGRAFSDTDAEDTPRVVIVNETFVSRFWPDGEALGRRIELAGADHEVVGVASDGKYWSIGEEPMPYVYRSLSQAYSGAFFVHVRTRGDPAGVLPAIRARVRELDAALPVSDLQTMSAALGFALLPARTAATVVGGFALLSLLLAAVGLYALVSHSVVRRYQELGVRVALGARSVDVVLLVVGHAAKLTAVGIVLGLGLGFVLNSLMAGLLYGVSPTSVEPFAAAAVLLATVSLVASLLPALGAVRLDPSLALRAE